MHRRSEVEAGADIAGAGGTPDPASVPSSAALLGPALAAFRPSEPPVGIDRMLDHRPIFRRRRHGYDRVQVDNYVAWAEGELDAARRECDHLLERYGACMAELTLNRRAPIGTPSGAVSQRLGQMLRLASQEAEAVVAAGVDEAERVVAEARLEAQARLAKVSGIREASIAAGEHIREQARREAHQLLQEAAERRDNAQAEAARQLAAVQAEVDDLRRQRDEARESLHRLTARIGQALQAVAAGDPAELASLADRQPVGSTVA
jgi:hypothetical protein